MKNTPKTNIKTGEYRMNDDIPGIGGKYYFSFHFPSADIPKNSISGLKLMANTLDQAIQEAKLITMFDQKYTSSESWCIFEADPFVKLDNDRSDHGWLFHPYTARYFSKKENTSSKMNRGSRQMKIKETIKVTA